MKTSEMKNSSGSKSGIKINGTKSIIDNFNSTFSINDDSEKEPAKLLSKVLNEEPVLNTSRRQIYRDNFPLYNDYLITSGENKNSLDITKINADISKLCTSVRELKDRDTSKGTGVFLVPFRIISGSYCWTLLSKDSLTHQLQNAEGERIATAKIEADKIAEAKKSKKNN